MHTTSFIIASALFVSCAHALIAPPSEHENRAAARVYTTCTQPKTLAITFDDGPNTYTKTIVDTLDKAGGKHHSFKAKRSLIRITDNCIYDTTNADRAKYAFDRGHQVASHTWSHLHLPTLSTAQITSEFQRANDAIKKITGAVPAFVRPPFGEYNANVQNVAGSFGQSLVTWDLDSQDWNGVSQTEATYKSRIDSNANGILTLNHEVYVLPWVINYAKSKGYKLVTVAECVGAQPYISKGSPSARDKPYGAVLSSLDTHFLPKTRRSAQGLPRRTITAHNHISAHNLCYCAREPMIDETLQSFWIRQVLLTPVTPIQLPEFASLFQGAPESISDTCAHCKIHIEHHDPVRSSIQTRHITPHIKLPVMLIHNDMYVDPSGEGWR
ncbi:chitin deacetylase [Rhizoctonia solani AG-1 IA]|uniref:Chitin deacetylase n=1 Tax=Thanatephorus cucumeris (strain AG1-IA) TaxID=983506 RepID=L8WS40_THACA|nr:chitin deacetylase [Rhizoctonia solani AG-1 IA]